MIDKLSEKFQKYADPCALKKKWESDQKIGSGFYYAMTYRPILSFFQQHPQLDDALELKIALVFSWNPKICEVSQNNFEKGVGKLEVLRECAINLKDAKIDSIDIDKYLPPLWDACAFLISGQTSPKGGVSVTKFLHFSFPDIFPMVDIKTMQWLTGTAVYNEEKYSDFLKAWKPLFISNKKTFETLSATMGMPVARILDIMIFNPR